MKLDSVHGTVWLTPLNQRGEPTGERIPLLCEAGTPIEISIEHGGDWCAPAEIIFDLVPGHVGDVIHDPEIGRREPTQAEMVAEIAETIDRADQVLNDWDDWKDAASWSPDA